MMFLKYACLALLLIATIYTYGQGQPGAPRITGQETATGAQVIINEVNTAQYPTVRIFATVLKDGSPLKGLGASDFRVREDEVDQEPITVEPKLPPLSVVITLDTSGSMAKRMKETQAAAISFLDTLGSHDSAQVVAFAREVRRLTTMSTNRQAARDEIGKTTARGDTALYNALYESIQLVKDRTGRKAIVLLSDGVDDDGTGRPLSTHTLQDVIRGARQVNVPIYVLGLGTELDEAGLTETAQATGALYFNAPQASDLKALYAKIGEQLAGQYAITYTSNLPVDGTEHRVALTSGGVTDTKTYKAPGTTETPKPPDRRRPAQSASALFKEVYAYANGPFGMTLPPAAAKQFAETWVLQHHDKDFGRFKEVYNYANGPFGMSMPPAAAKELALHVVSMRDEVSQVYSDSDNFRLFKEVYAYANAPFGMSMPPAAAKRFAEAWVLKCANGNLIKFKEAYNYANAPFGMSMPPAKAQEYALQTVNCPLS